MKCKEDANLKREANVKRKTAETEVELDLVLDGTGKVDLDTELPFFEHMLELLAWHGGFDLRIKAKGDLDVGAHHLVEDLGICMGRALNEALADKRGIRRYGQRLMPMDEALVLVAVDISGRPYLGYDLCLPSGDVEGLDPELVEEFWQALVNEGKLALHLKLLSGRNKHHIIEAVFKGVGRALGEAVSIDSGVRGVPSTKGTLGE